MKIKIQSGDGDGDDGNDMTMMINMMKVKELLMIAILSNDIVVLSC